MGFSQIEGLILIEFGTHSPPSAHVCFGQQVEPSTGNFGWHVAGSGGKTPPRQEGTQVRPLGLITPDPQVPTASGSQSVPRYDRSQVEASILVFLHLRPSAHVCFGQQVEPSTGFFGRHVAEGGGKTPPRQEGTQVRPQLRPQGWTVAPQAPRAPGVQGKPL